MPYPLTLPQQNIWHLQQTFGSVAATLTMSAVFNKPVSEAALRDALLKTYSQTDVLRLSISTRDGEAEQDFLPLCDPNIPTLDFRSLNALNKWTEKLAGTPLKKPSLWQAYILRAGNHIGLAFHCHHLLADAWGLYQIALRIHAKLVDKDIFIGNYIDFIKNEQEYIASPKRARDFAYFEREFSRCPAPVYLADKSGASFAAKRYSDKFSRSLSQKINVIAEKMGTSAYALFLYAYGKAIAESRATERLFIGTTVLNRMGRQELGTAGMFVNTVPVLMDFSRTSDARELITEQTVRLMGVFRHQRCGYTNLLEHLRKKYEFSGGLYDVILNFQNIRIDSNEIGADIRWHFSGVQGETLQLHIHDWAGEDCYRVDYDYRSAMLSAGKVRRLHRRVEEILTALESTVG